ncbi:ATP-dependent protease ATP-binding subunit [Streptococcus pneumoniae]|nr:ATP-dependent protease ATP-binding subunit [Streptococcus pneumoniae]CAG6339917.1 ATP-dependent protease ATP-binding subunit [Streptococcus pneumoniae]
MSTNRKNDMMVYCSFCGKNQEEVQKIIAGNNAFICNECVELAQEIIREELVEEVLADLSEVPKPIELLHILNHYVIGQDRAKRALAVAVITTTNASISTIHAKSQKMWICRSQTF